MIKCLRYAILCEFCFASLPYLSLLKRCAAVVELSLEFPISGNRQKVHGARDETI